MKSGDAVNIATLFYYMEHMDELSCNLLVVTNCVEENDHRVLFKSQVNFYVCVKLAMILKWLSIQILFRYHMTVMIRNISTQAQLEKC